MHCSSPSFLDNLWQPQRQGSMIADERSRSISPTAMARKFIEQARKNQYPLSHVLGIMSKSRDLKFSLVHHHETAESSQSGGGRLPRYNFPLLPSTHLYQDEN